MKVLIINTSERTGGAAIAANRLTKALNNNGIEAKMLVRDKVTEDLTTIALPSSWSNKWCFLWERIVIWSNNCFRKENLFAIDIANTGKDITTLPEFIEADVIHLHWINQGMLSLATIRSIVHSGKPIVWTMHDMWPFTGICHYAGECNKFHTQCHHCPLLYKSKEKDLAYRIFQKKKELFDETQITFVACSQWLEGIARQSALFKKQKVTNIPNALNTDLFKPYTKQAIQELRNQYHLPPNKRLLLFGSVKVTDKRKGFDYLAEACNILSTQYPLLKEQIGIVVFGNETDAIKEALPFPVYSMNYISSEQELANVYNAIDLYVTPSLQDNLPNTIAEASACGVPCIGFNVGGIPQMIEHMRNGYVAEYQNAKDFAGGIYWALQEANPEKLREEARAKAMETYEESSVAMKYLNIYKLMKK